MRWNDSFWSPPTSKPSALPALCSFFIVSPLWVFTPGSKVSCLTVNVLSFPQREARHRENYSVPPSVNLQCVTRSYAYLRFTACAQEIPPLHLHARMCVCAWGYERSQSQSAILACLSTKLNSIFYTLSWSRWLCVNLSLLDWWAETLTHTHISTLTHRNSILSVEVVPVRPVADKREGKMILW